MTIYWQSTKSPVHLFKREYECEEVAKHLVEYSFVDPAILRVELAKPALHAMSIRAYQRRLGAREISNKRKLGGKKKVVRKAPEGREEILAAFLRSPEEGQRLALAYGKSKDYAYKLAHARKLLPHQIAVMPPLSAEMPGKQLEAAE